MSSSSDSRDSRSFASFNVILSKVISHFTNRLFSFALLTAKMSTGTSHILRRQYCFNSDI